MPLRDILLALLVVVIWAANIIAIKLALGEAEPMTVLALRLGLTALVFLPFIGGLTRATAWHLAQIALLMGAAHQSLLFLGMVYVPAGITTILLQTQVIFAALLGIFVFRENAGWRTWAGIGLGLAGVAVMFTSGHAPFETAEGRAFATGFVILIASAVCIALAYMRLKQMPKVPPGAFLFGINAFAVPPVALFALWREGDALASLPTANWWVLGGVFAFQIVLVSISHIIWQRLLARNPLSQVTPFVLLLPLFGVGMAVALLDETLTAAMAAGGLITMMGVGIIVIRTAQKNRVPKDTLTQASATEGPPAVS